MNRVQQQFVKDAIDQPEKLTDWMIQAIRMCILVDRIGTVSRKHFQELKLHQSRWSEGRWLEKTEVRGLWKAGRNFPAANFKAAHPISWAQIEADWPVWGAKLSAPPKAAAPVQEGLDL